MEGLRGRPGKGPQYIIINCKGDLQRERDRHMQRKMLASRTQPEGSKKSDTYNYKHQKKLGNKGGGAIKKGKTHT